MDLEDNKYFEKMSNYSPRNTKAYYKLMINNSAQEELSGETSSENAKRRISHLLIAIEELGKIK